MLPVLSSLDYVTSKVGQRLRGCYTTLTELTWALALHLIFKAVDKVSLTFRGEHSQTFLLGPEGTDGASFVVFQLIVVVNQQRVGADCTQILC